MGEAFSGNAKRGGYGGLEMELGVWIVDSKVQVVSHSFDTTHRYSLQS